MFYISISSYEYSEIKSAAEQVILALMRGSKGAKVDCITNVYFQIEVNEMNLNVSLCDIEGFSIDESSFFTADISSEKLTAVMMSQMASYMLYLFKGGVK